MKTAYIVGCGPSLNETDLSLLAGKHSFGMNWIHLHYPNTNWRPTYWVMADGGANVRVPAELWEEYVLTHVDNPDQKCFMRYDLANQIQSLRKRYQWPDNLTPLRINCAHQHMNIHSLNLPTAWHLPSYCQFGTTSHVTMQLAINMRFQRIVLLGMDLGYKVPESKWDKDPNHFHPGYGNNFTYPLEDKEETELYVFELAKHACIDRGIQVINCTPGGNLNTFERQSLEDVVHDS